MITQSNVSVVSVIFFSYLNLSYIIQPYVLYITNKSPVTDQRLFNLLNE